MSLVWNAWVGYTKPLMDFRNDGPMPSPPDNPSDTECFWHSCVPVTAVPELSPFDATVEVVPTGFTSVNEVWAPDIDDIFAPPESQRPLWNEGRWNVGTW